MWRYVVALQRIESANTLCVKDDCSLLAFDQILARAIPIRFLHPIPVDLIQYQLCELLLRPHIRTFTRSSSTGWSFHGAYILFLIINLVRLEVYLSELLRPRFCL